jgi:hypothetical protein
MTVAWIGVPASGIGWFIERGPVPHPVTEHTAAPMKQYCRSLAVEEWDLEVRIRNLRGWVRITEATLTHAGESVQYRTSSMHFCDFGNEQYHYEVPHC